MTLTKFDGLISHSKSARNGGRSPWPLVLPVRNLERLTMAKYCSHNSKAGCSRQRARSKRSLASVHFWTLGHVGRLSWYSETISFFGHFGTEAGCKPAYVVSFSVSVSVSVSVYRLTLLTVGLLSSTVLTARLLLLTSCLRLSRMYLRMYSRLSSRDDMSRYLLLFTISQPRFSAPSVSSLSGMMRRPL